MMSFDEIAVKLLESQGYEVAYCNSDEEAILKAEELKLGSKAYPVHFSVSNTSGEKEYEEFFTDEENVDMERFDSLGVVTDKAIPNKDSVRVLFEELNEAFSDISVTKEQIVNIMKSYLPNFEHIEKGKSLDSKM